MMNFGISKTVVLLFDPKLLRTPVSSLKGQVEYVDAIEIRVRLSPKVLLSFNRQSGRQILSDGKIGGWRLSMVN